MRRMGRVRVRTPAPGAASGPGRREAPELGRVVEQAQALDPPVRELEELGEGQRGAVRFEVALVKDADLVRAFDRHLLEQAKRAEAGGEVLDAPDEALGSDAVAGDGTGEIEVRVEYGAKA